jgi:hypothetical protein
LRACDDHYADSHSRNDTVPNREVLWTGEGAHREFGDDGTPFFHFSEDLFVLLGINYANPATQDADRRSRERTERAFVRAGINAARQAADDYQATISQVPSQLLCHLIPVGGGTTRADGGNQVAIQKFNVSPDIQEGRRIINLA